MRLEDKYEAQLKELGIWQDAFEAEVHTLSMMERELRRVQKAWKAAQSDLVKARKDGGVEEKELVQLLKAVDGSYALILTLRRDILSHRDALGLTPKGLQRLRGKEGGMPDGTAAPSARQVSDAFSALKARCESYE